MRRLECDSWFLGFPRVSFASSWVSVKTSKSSIRGVEGLHHHFCDQKRIWLPGKKGSEDRFYKVTLDPGIHL